MKLIAIGVGGSGAASIECLVHLAVLGFLPADIELVPVIVDPDQGHPRLQGAGTFVAAYSRLREVGGIGTDGLFGPTISQIVGAQALRPSEQANLFSLLGLSQPMARSLASAFFSDQEIGEAGSSEFDHGYYGRVNAGVAFFNDPSGRAALMEALGHLVLGGDAAIVLVGSAFGGTGAAGLIHLARVLREDPGLQAVPLRLAAVQLEPYFRPDQRDPSASSAFVNVPETFESRTGAAYQFLAGLAANLNLPFHAFYALGVRTPAAFPPEWFKLDQQNNPHLFLEYLAALAVRDFAINGRALTSVLRHRREAVPPFEGPLAVLRECLYDATALRLILNTYVLPIVGAAGSEGQLPGHPWISKLCSAAGLSPSELADHFSTVSSLIADVLVAAGIDRQEGVVRAGASAREQGKAGRRADLTRESFPIGLAPRADNFDLAASLRHANPEALFSTYNPARDGKLPARALFRWIAAGQHPTHGGTSTIPRLERHVGEVFHQWTQQGANGNVLGIKVPPDDNFQSANMDQSLRKLASADWRRPLSTPRIAGEYPSIWAPALVHRDELYSRLGATKESRYMHLGLLACVLLSRKHLSTPPARLIVSAPLAVAFKRSLQSTFPMAQSYDVTIAAGGVLVIYESAVPLDVAAVPPPEDVIGFFYPDTVVVPAAGISHVRREWVTSFGELVAGRGFAKLLYDRIANDWVNTLTACGVPGAAICGPQFITFLASFDDDLVGRPLVPEDRFDGFPVTAAADWIHRLYR